MFSWYKEEEEEKEVVTVRAQWVWTGAEGHGGRREVGMFVAMFVNY